MHSFVCMHDAPATTPLRVNDRNRKYRFAKIFMFIGWCIAVPRRSATMTARSLRRAYDAPSNVCVCMPHRWADSASCSCKNRHPHTRTHTTCMLLLAADSPHQAFATRNFVFSFVSFAVRWGAVFSIPSTEHALYMYCVPSILCICACIFYTVFSSVVVSSACLYKPINICIIVYSF